MHGIAKGIEKSTYLGRNNLGVATLAEHDRIFVGHSDILCKASIQMHTLDLDRRTDMLVAGAAQMAVPACQMHLGCYVITDFKTQVLGSRSARGSGTLSDFLYNTAKLMPDQNRLVGLVLQIPLHFRPDTIIGAGCIDALVRTAYRSGEDFDLDLIQIGLGLGVIIYICQTVFVEILFDQALHGPIGIGPGLIRFVDDG